MLLNNYCRESCSIFPIYRMLYYPFRSSCSRAVLLILSLTSASAYAAAAAAAAAAEGLSEAELTSGQTGYTTCVACHGVEGHGNALLHAPAIAGQEAWYLKRQLDNFKAGVRGSHAEDVYGAQMRPMAMLLQNDQQVDSVAAYIAQMSPASTELTLGGDAAKGKASYNLCLACHGADAKGNEALNAPSLQGQYDWYMVAQLRNFKAGIRGADPKDVYGAQMRPMAMTVPDEASMANLAAYIHSLGVSSEASPKK